MQRRSGHRPAGSAGCGYSHVFCVRLQSPARGNPQVTIDNPWSQCISANIVLLGGGNLSVPTQPFGGSGRHLPFAPKILHRAG
ncbi:hypothetical protein KCP75_00985 [Salmonella enterica subsp. enterica]|nr:hypothetical protein KCP75_00985 [Salmonella enterica subsp. enterica]